MITFTRLLPVLGLTVTALASMPPANAAPGNGAPPRAFVVRGTSGADVITLSRTTEGTLLVNGVPARGAKLDKIDGVSVIAGAGNDTVSVNDPAGTLPTVTLNGQDGNDFLLGGNGDDRILGGAGDDFADGGRGADVADMGDGSDEFRWLPGGGNDTIDGGPGQDVHTFVGAAVGERFVLTADGEGGVLTRDVGLIRMGLASVETVKLAALGGTDDVEIGTMTGTAVSRVDIDLGGPAGGSDGAEDHVRFHGTGGADFIRATFTAGQLNFSGLSGETHVVGSEATDVVGISADAGDDVVDGQSLPSGLVTFFASGGDGADVLIGGPGSDQLLGDGGDDVLTGNGGTDVLDGGPGDNTVLP